MMIERPEWFAPKRYGYGAGLPIAWQGWAVMIAYFAVVIGAITWARERWWLTLAIVLPASALLVLITARTTRGGWKWRWGERGRPSKQQ